MSRLVRNIFSALSRLGRVRRPTDDPAAARPGRRLTRRGLLALAAWYAASAAFPSIARAAGPSEYDVKAALIYKFALFIEWPSDSFADHKSPFIIATVGEDPFAGAIEQAVQGKNFNGHPIVVKHFANSGVIEHCHIIYVGASEQGDLPKILEKAGDSTLTVGDSENFTGQGGIFRFFREETRIRFEVNLGVAQRSRLRISAKLLKLAKVYGS